MTCTTLFNLEWAAEILTRVICKTSDWSFTEVMGKVTKPRDILTPQDKVAAAAAIWSRVSRLEDPAQALTISVKLLIDRRRYHLPQLLKLCPVPDSEIDIGAWLGFKGTSLRASQRHRKVRRETVIEMRNQVHAWLDRNMTLGLAALEGDEDDEYQVG